MIYGREGLHVQCAVHLGSKKCEGRENENVSAVKARSKVWLTDCRPDAEEACTPAWLEGLARYVDHTRCISVHYTVGPWENEEGQE